MNLSRTLSDLDVSPFRAVFDKHLAKQGGGGAAFAATLDGREVLSVFGGEAQPGVPWVKETPAMTMSVTKGWAGMCAQLLVDRGSLDVDALVSDYWPEFGCNGKERATVRQVLLHTVGVIGLPHSSSIVSWDGSGWDDLDAIAASLAGAKPAWEPGTSYGYHAVTYGWLVGEIVRRVSGMTLGQFFAKEIAAPLGLRAAIGVDGARLAEMATVSQSENVTRWPLSIVAKKMRDVLKDPDKLLGQAFMADGTLSIASAPDLLTSEGFFRAELPSSNGISSAADLARLFALLACDGELDGKRLLSSKVVADFASHQQSADDVVVGRSAPFLVGGRLAKLARTHRSLGYLTNLPDPKKRRFGPSHLAYGSEGLGGQVAFCDPERRLSVGFVRSRLSDTYDFQRELIAALYKALDG